MPHPKVGLHLSWAIGTYTYLPTLDQEDECNLFSESYNGRGNLSRVGQHSHAARTLFLGLAYTLYIALYFAGAAVLRLVRPCVVAMYDIIIYWGN